MELTEFEKSKLINYSSVIDDSLSDFIIGIPYYFSEKGYHVDQTFPEVFFSVFGEIRSRENVNFKELEKFISPLVAKSEAEFKSFHTDYVNYIENRHEDGGLTQIEKDKLGGMRASFKKQQKQMEKLLEDEEKLKKQIQEESGQKEKPLAPKKFLETYEKQFKKVKKNYANIFEKTPFYEKLLMIGNVISGKQKNTFTQNDVHNMRETLKDKLKAVMGYSDASEILSFITTQSKALDYIQKDIAKRGVTAEMQLEKTIASKKRTEEELQRLRDAFKANAEKIVDKRKPSEQHRDQFLRLNNRAVRSSFEGIVELNRTFKQLSMQDKENIKNYIHDNAKKFRTRVSRNIRTSSRHTIDISETCKSACQTMGVPLKIEYVKPKREKTKLIMFLDVSGSCREASEIMLTFMNEMKELFHGGCKTYVFVNSLFDVSDIFYEAGYNSNAAIWEITNVVATRGVYSDYYTPFRSFCEEKFHEITKDSIVFFIGDARNNRNPSGEEYIRAIARRARKTYWLNTDDFEMWNQGDSIFDIYAKYMSDYCECVTVSQLLNFLTNVR